MPFDLKVSLSASALWLILLLSEPLKTETWKACLRIVYCIPCPSSFKKEEKGKNIQKIIK